MSVLTDAIKKAHKEGKCLGIKVVTYEEAMENTATASVLTALVAAEKVREEK